MTSAVVTREDPAVPASPPPAGRAHLPLRDELYLFAHDDDTGKLHVHPQALGVALAAAVLIDLFLDGRIEIADQYRIRLRHQGATGDVITDDAMATLGARPVGPPMRLWLRGFGGDLYERTRAHLISSGILHRTPRHRLAGLLKSEAYVPVDTRYPVIARAAVRYLAIGRETPINHTAALCGLVCALHLEPQLYLDQSGTRLHTHLQRIADRHFPAVRTILTTTDAIIGDLATAAYR